MSEREYCEKRSGELREQMIEATRACDRVAFAKAYETALRYMKRGELRNMMVMFVSHMAN